MQALPQEGSRSTRTPADDEIFVGNLSFFCAEQDLFELFSRFAAVRETRVMKKDKGRRSLLFGFVRFNSRFEAVQMVRLFNGHLFMGRRMKVELSVEKQSESKPEEGFQVHVVLSSTFSTGPHERRVVPTEEFLYKVLLVFGFIVDVSIKEYSVFSNRQQGYGFVTFEQESSMHEAISRCQNWLVDGVTISCTPARDMLKHNNNNGSHSQAHAHAHVFSHKSHAHIHAHSSSTVSYGVPSALPAHLSLSAHAQRSQSSSPSLFFPDVPPFPAHFLNGSINNHNNADNYSNFNNGRLSSRSFSRRQDLEQQPQQAYSPGGSLSANSASMPLSARSNLTTSSHNSRIAEDRLSSFHGNVPAMTGDAQEREREGESERERDSRLFSSFLASSHNMHPHSLAHNNLPSHTPSLSQTQTQTRALPLSAYPSAPLSLSPSSLSAPPSLSLSSHSSSSVQRSVFPLSDDRKHFYE